MALKNTEPFYGATPQPASLKPSSRHAHPKIKKKHSRLELVLRFANKHKTPKETTKHKSTYFLPKFHPNSSF